MPVVREGYPYILTLCGIGLICIVAGWPWPGIIFLALAGFVTFFFRDPERVFTSDKRMIASPADGKIISIRKQNNRDVFSIFLSIFDVHVNRSPMGGRISSIEYRPGKFLVAFDDRASQENEQNRITVEREGRSVQVVQIAGILARRIVCWKHEGETISTGERIGLIKFGSRVDVFLPEDCKLRVQLGQKVKGGETVVGELQ